MSFPLALHDHHHPQHYPYDSSIRAAAPPWAPPRAPDTPADEPEDPYDAAKESPIVDTLVEGAVVLLIAALINLTFWGLVRFGVTGSALHYGEVA